MDKRVLIAGNEIGGQMQLLAETLRKKGVDAASIAFNIDFRQFHNDYRINPSGWNGTAKRISFFWKALRYYDVFHFFWGISLLAIWRFHLIDLPILKLFGKKIIIHFRGTDIVNINYYDYLIELAKGNIPEVIPPKSRPDQKKKLKIWLKYADIVLVSTPDLLFTSNNAILSPQAINLEEWNPDKIEERRVSENNMIKIVHAPTRRNTKGTEFILNTITELRNEGYLIELILVENKPFKEMQSIFAQCDLGIDQLLHGWYGKVSVELMALGKPVVCYISEEFDHVYPDLPLIKASTSTLRDTLISLIHDATIRKEAGMKGIAYVRKYHDVQQIADTLIELYRLN